MIENRNWRGNYHHTRYQELYLCTKLRILLKIQDGIFMKWSHFTNSGCIFSKIKFSFVSVILCLSAELLAICPAKLSFNTFHWTTKSVCLITVIPSNASYIIWLCFPPCQGESDLVLLPSVHQIPIMIQKVPQHSIWLLLPSAWNVQLRGYLDWLITDHAGWECFPRKKKIIIIIIWWTFSYCCFRICSSCLLLIAWDFTLLFYR